MLIQLSELKMNPAKYFDLAKTMEIIVTRRGERLGRLVSEEDAAKTDASRAYARLIALADGEARPDGRADPAKEARLSEKGLI